MNPKEQAEAEKYAQVGEKPQPKCLVDDCEIEVIGENVLCDFHNENLPF